MLAGLLVIARLVVRSISLPSSDAHLSVVFMLPVHSTCLAWSICASLGDYGRHSLRLRPRATQQVGFHKRMFVHWAARVIALGYAVSRVEEARFAAYSNGRPSFHKMVPSLKPAHVTRNLTQPAHGGRAGFLACSCAEPHLVGSPCQ